MKKIMEVIAVCSLVLSADAINSKAETHHPALPIAEGKEHHPHHREEIREFNEPTDYSIFNLDNLWLTQENMAIKLNDLRGKVAVLSMFYSSCDYACPRILADMKRIQSQVDEGKQGQVVFVLVSIDAKRDTPQRLKAFAVENGLDSKHWYLLHVTENDILELAALLGVKYRSVSETDFAHSNLITVPNKEGEIAHQQEGLGLKHTETSAAVNKLIN